MLSPVVEVKRARAWRVPLVALGGVLSMLLFGLLGIHETVGNVYDEQPYASTSVGELLPSVTLGQSFVAEYPGLFSIEVNLATYARDNTGPIVFHLKTSPDATEDLVTLTFDASDVENNAYRAFEFPPIRDSAGRQLAFCLEAPEAEPGNAITVWGHTKDVYHDGDAALDGLEGHGVRDLSFRLGYDLSFGQKVDIFVNRLVENKPSLWGDKWLYLLLAVTYLVLLCALLVRAMKIDSPEENGG